jgi:hypothetical protein
MYFGLIIDAAIIGIVIVAMEQGEFPGWGAMLGCAILIGATRYGVTHYATDGIWPLGVLAGALVGGMVISWLCDMSLRRGALAAGIYLAARFLVHWVF